MNYAGQARFGRPVALGSNSSRPKPCEAKFCVLKDMVCLNCEKTGCRVSSCKEGPNYERIAKNKVLSFACPHRNRRANVSFAETLEQLSEELSEVLFASNDIAGCQMSENSEQDIDSQCFNTGFIEKNSSGLKTALDRGAASLANALDDEGPDDEEGF